MPIFIKSPFKCNRIEDDPLTYGLRDDIIKSSILELMNDQSILISGARGIGKSSLCAQLQAVLNGDDTLLQRCMFSVKIPKFITASHVCLEEETLVDIISCLIDELEKKLQKPEQKFKFKTKVEFSLGLIKAALDIEKDSRISVNTLAQKFVEAIININETFIEPHINIAIDEIDQIEGSVNIAHFIKATMEKLTTKGIYTISFILVGQTGIYNKLISRQPAFERNVKHIKLSTLDMANSRYVLLSCLKKVGVDIDINDVHVQFIIGLASGFPYLIHLISHETFIMMCDRYDTIPKYLQIMTEDIVKGINSILENKRDRFDNMINTLDPSEKKLLFSLAKDEQQRFPYRFAIEYLKAYGDDDSLTITKSLCDKLVFSRKILSRDQSVVYIFNEELFRIYLTYSIRQHEFEIRKVKWESIEDITLNVNDNFY